MTTACVSKQRQQSLTAWCGIRSRTPPRPQLQSGAARAALWLLAGLAPVSAADSPTPVRTPIRHVIVVENTRNMDRQRETSADIASKLIIHGFGQRARPGDGVELWLVDDQVRTEVFERFTWDRLGAVERSTQAYRFLRGLRPKAATAAVGAVIPTVVPGPGPARPTAVYLLTSGVDSLLGTPYDEQVNAIFFRHRERLRKARIPFVTVLVGQHAAWIGHAVTPGDRTPYIPPLPMPRPTDPPASPDSPGATGAEGPSPAPPRVTPAPLPLTVEEISRQIREQTEEKARLKPAETAPTAPQLPKGSPTAHLEAPAVVEPTLPPAEPAVTLTQERRSPTGALPLPREFEAVSQSTQEEAELPEPSGLTVRSDRAERVGAPDPATQAAPGLDANAGPFASARPEQRSRRVGSPWKDAAVALTLLFTAAAVGLLLVRTVGLRRSPSLITESLDRVRDRHAPYPGPGR